MDSKSCCNNVSRRRFFLGTAALLAAPSGLNTVCCAAPAPPQPPEDSVNLTHYQEAELGGKERGPVIWLRWNNAPLLAYRAQQGQKFPYFYPLMGPVSGLPMTTESALPWPHHRSLYFGCDHLNSANFWQGGLEQGRVASTGPRVTEATSTSAVIVDECEWVVPDKPVQMTDKRTYTVTAEIPQRWMIDVAIEWKAEVDVEVVKNNHSLFALRCAADISVWGGGVLANSNGDQGEEATFGKPASWCAFYGKRVQAKNEPTEGIALFDHPGNPWNPCPWFTRDYGFISSTPFNFIENPWRMAAGQSVALKYRVVVFSGDPLEAELDALHAKWIRG